MRYLIFILLSFFLFSCGTSDKVSNNPEIDFKAGPPTLVYKTKADYSKNVPVILSEDKSNIVSYPHMSDLKYKGEMAYPTQLEKGYLLDNRGISKNVAFISLTYDEYSKLTNVPSADSLYGLIIDNDPLKVLYDCGNRNQWEDPVVRLNEIIKKRKLKKCKKVVIR